MRNYWICGPEPAAPILLASGPMEYRGYDSAGVAVRSETAASR